MKSNKIINNLLQNWSVKMFSFLVAIALYIIITLSLLGSISVEIPLSVIHPKGYEALSIVDEKIELTIRAQQKYVALINPHAINAVADFSFVNSDGVASARVILEFDESLFDIDFSLFTNPEFIRVFYEKVQPSDDEVSL